MHSRFRYRCAEALRPLAMRMPRGGSFLIRLALGTGNTWYDREHRYVPVYDVRMKTHLVLDMTYSHYKWYYFTGHHGNRDIRLLIDRYVGPGDTFIDVGAHFGTFAAYANWRVGKTGRVFAYEPNPEVFTVLAANLLITQSAQCQARNVGIANAPGILRLNIIPERTYGASFRQGSEGNEGVEVVVDTLDRLHAGQQYPGRVFVKLDAEGYELNILRGMERLLETPGLVICCEITQTYLSEAGASPAEVFDLVRARNFRAYRFERFRSSLGREGLKFTELDAPPSVFQCDVLFSREDPRES